MITPRKCPPACSDLWDIGSCAWCTNGLMVQEYADASSPTVYAVALKDGETLPGCPVGHEESVRQAKQEVAHDSNPNA